VVAREYGGERRGPCCVEGRAERLQAEQEHDHDDERQGLDRHGCNENRPCEVGDDHHGASRIPIGESGQQRPEQQVRHVGQGIGERSQSRGRGAVEDQHRERHAGQLVTRDGQHAGQEQRPELGVPEDVAPARTLHHPTLHTQDHNHNPWCDTSRL
jgi:hypothetical protein